MIWGICLFHSFSLKCQSEQSTDITACSLKGNINRAWSSRYTLIDNGMGWQSGAQGMAFHVVTVFRNHRHIHKPVKGLPPISRKCSSQLETGPTKLNSWDFSIFKSLVQFSSSKKHHEVTWVSSNPSTFAGKPHTPMEHSEGQLDYKRGEKRSWGPTFGPSFPCLPHFNATLGLTGP